MALELHFIKTCFSRPLQRFKLYVQVYPAKQCPVYEYKNHIKNKARLPQSETMPQKEAELKRSEFPDKAV